MGGKIVIQTLCFLPLLYPLLAVRLLAILVVGALCGAAFWLLDIMPLAAGGLWLVALLVAMRSSMVARRAARQRRLLDAIETFSFTGPRYDVSPRAEPVGRPQVGVRLGHVVPPNTRAPVAVPAPEQAADRASG